MRRRAQPDENGERPDAIITEQEQLATNRAVPSKQPVSTTRPLERRRVHVSLILSRPQPAN